MRGNEGLTKLYQLKAIYLEEKKYRSVSVFVCFTSFIFSLQNIHINIKLDHLLFVLVSPFCIYRNWKLKSDNNHLSIIRFITPSVSFFPFIFLLQLKNGSGRTVVLRRRRFGGVFRLYLHFVTALAE